MKGSEFIFDNVDLLHCYLQKTSLNRTASSYIDSPEWLKNKKVTINSKNNDDNCFLYALTVALNYQKIKSFINQYDWKGIHFPLCKEDWKKFESNNKSIALIILFVPYNTKQIVRPYPPKKHNNKRKNQVIFLMITDVKNGIILLWKVCRDYYQHHQIMWEALIA